MRRGPWTRWTEHSGVVDRHLMRDFDHRGPRPVDWVLGACQMTRAEVRRRLGEYDTRIFSHGGEDTDWCIRVWRAGFEVHYVPDAVVVHAYQHMTRKRPLSKQALRALTDFYYVQWKHRRARHQLAPR
jgi:GT2 family glycosyltransferase